MKIRPSTHSSIPGGRRIWWLAGISMTAFGAVIVAGHFVRHQGFFPEILRAPGDVLLYNGAAWVAAGVVALLIGLSMGGESGGRERGRRGGPEARRPPTGGPGAAG